MRGRRRRSEAEIRREYRRLLNRPRLSDAEIERMRAHVRLLAQAICEHVWETKVF